MNLNLKFIFVLVLVSAIVGCDYTVKNGEVPEEYLKDAQQYVGVYQGYFGQKIKGRIKVSVEGLKPILTFEGENGEGLLGANCTAQIGKLESIQFRTSRNGIKVFNFALRHDCKKIVGKTVQVVANSAQELKLFVDQSWRISSFCKDEEVALPEPVATSLAEVFDGTLGLGMSLKSTSLPVEPRIPEVPDFDYTRSCTSYLVGRFARLNQ